MSAKSKKRGIGLSFALQGIGQAIKKERNMKIHVAAAISALIMGVLLKLNSIEWIVLVLVIALVVVVEMLNTCIEVIMDLIKPEYHIMTKYIKDMAAGAVLVAAIAAAVTGLILFAPKLIEFVLL
ncbi:Undecaprenol kinase [Lentibacillus sp. JNUCC-1]|uniref:diacylglycerol kinase family protein n=1 Tax=Lentibacillus sp. JNUCC-1 TaxID=2654513 RepID=UPI001326DEF3|nr:diacylglycerol kinase family protein [Lentibacillus sp. JNUCC-1]MUV39604.1 Undecaprenol kinase [Lentibacillus sp. JNUCC-1]